MATMDRKPDREHLAADHSRVRSPLGVLRKYIRMYVSLEGLGFFLTFLFLWFWIGLLLDYGVLFKLLGIDYAQSLPLASTTGQILRVGLLGGLLAWLATRLIFLVVVRFFRDFSDPSLALLLERRYPDELGDRLITAVELADPEKAAMQGYSVVMVEETIHEAAQRVQKVPIRDVFDWGRLLRTGLIVVLLGAVGYTLAVGLFHQFRLYQSNRGDLSGFQRFHDVATIWVKRNVLLQDTPWPRDQQLVVLFPAQDPARLGYNLGRTPVRYRALKYVVADENDAQGWRPLLYKDLLDERVKLVEGEVPAPPENWKGKYHPEGEISLDEIELACERLPIRSSDPDIGADSAWNLRELREDGEGYRPLRWSDLRGNPQFGILVPRLSATWDPRGVVALFGAGTASFAPNTLSALALADCEPGADLTVDDVLATLNDLDRRRAQKKVTDPALLEKMLDVRAVFDRLERLDRMRDLATRVNSYLQQPALSQVARILTLPDQADLVSTLRNSDTRVSISRTRDTNEFNGQIDLPNRSDTIYYYLRTDGYSTPTRTLQVIGPPQLLHLRSEEMQPAYLFYRWGQPRIGGGFNPDVKPQDLLGLKQKIDGADRLNAGSPVSRLEVPAGTDLTLKATAERPLAKVALTQGKGPPLPDNVIITGPDDTEEFTITFPNLRTDAVFQIDMTDLDGVTGTRNVTIKVREDNPPDLPDMKPLAILRKNKEGQYLVTPDARVPFDGQVLDDRGLSSIRYVYTVEKVDLIPKLNTDVLGLYLASFVSAGIRGQVPLTTLPLYLEATTRNARAEAERIAKVQVIRTPTLPGLIDAIKSGEIEKDPFLTLEAIKELLLQAQGLPFRPMVRRYDLVPDRFNTMRGESARLTPEKNDFPVPSVQFDGKALKVIGETTFQPRYKLVLWVEGVDNDVEGGVDRNGVPQPHVTSSKDRYNFLVIPEYELLLEINKSEELLNFRLMQLSRGVEGGKSWEHDSLTKMESDLGTDLVQLAGSNVKNAEVRQMAARIRAIQTLLGRGQTYCQDVLTDYRLLMQEMELNRVNEDELTKKRRDVVDPLGRVIDVSFPRAGASMNTFAQALLQAGGGEAATTVDPAALAAAKAQGALAQVALRELHNELEAVIQALEQVANLAKEIEKLKRLAEKKQAESELYERIKRIIEADELRRLEELLNPKSPSKP